MHYLYSIFYPYLLLLWLPLAFFAVERGKRILTFLFVLGCYLILRLQVELLLSMDKPGGVFGLMDSYVYHRGLVVYGLFIALFLLAAHASRGGDKNVHLAASITILIFSFCVSSLIMVL